MTTMNKEKKDIGIGKLHSVSLDRTLEKVYVTFEVVDEDYEDYILRISRRDDIKLIIVGERLDAVKKES